MKKRVRASTSRWKGKSPIDRDDKDTIPAAIWGCLEPLDKVAREKELIWGDQLPELVTPDLASRFRAAYEALGQKVEAHDLKSVQEIVPQLIVAWNMLEQNALQAGHKPLENAWCVTYQDYDGKHRCVCFAAHGWATLAQKHPDWVVHSFENAARIIAYEYKERVFEDMYSAFPNARISHVVDHGTIKVPEYEDEIPF